MSANPHQIGANPYGSNYPRGVTAADIDGPRNPFEGMSDGEIYHQCLTEEQRQQIALGFYETLDEEDLLEVFEVFPMRPAMRSRYLNYRNAAVRQLVRDGNVAANTKGR